jgi:hypothetical protein
MHGKVCRIPRWKELGKNHPLRCRAYVKGIQSLSEGSLIPRLVTLNLDHTDRLGVALDDQEGFLPYIISRLSKNLRKRLRRTPEMVFAVHATNTHGNLRPHVHGLILARPSEIAAIKDALQQTSGYPRTNDELAPEDDPNLTDEDWEARHDQAANRMIARTYAVRVRSPSARRGGLSGWDSYMADQLGKIGNTPDWGIRGPLVYGTPGVVMRAKAWVDEERSKPGRVKVQNGG